MLKPDSIRRCAMRSFWKRRVRVYIRIRFILLKVSFCNAVFI